MKVWPFFILFISTAPCIVEAQIRCGEDDYAQMLADYRRAFSRDSFEKAQTILLAAKNCQEADQPFIAAQLDTVIAGIAGQRDRAEHQKRTIFANDLASKSHIAFLQGDRSEAFRIAELAYNYVDNNNPNVIRALLKALYDNSLPITSKIYYRNSKVSGIDFSSDGSQIYIGYGEGRVNIWNIDNDKLENSFYHKLFLPYNSFYFSHDKKKYALVNDTSVSIWELENGHKIAELNGRFDKHCVAYSPNKNELAVGSSKYDFVSILNLQTGKIDTIHTSHDSSSSISRTKTTVSCLAYSIDGKSIAIGITSNILQIWDLNNKVLVKTLFDDNSGLMEKISFLPDNKSLAVAYKQVVKVWDVETEKMLHSIDGANILAISHNGLMFATCATGVSKDEVKVWDIKSMRNVITLSGHTSKVTHVAFSPNDQQLATGSEDETVRIWELTTQRSNFKYYQGGHEFPINNMSISPDGLRLATASDDAVNIWNIASCRKETAINGDLFVSFSSNGKYVATGYQGSSFSIWDAYNGNQVTSFSTRNISVASASFSPDTKFIATGTYGNDAFIWDVETGNKLFALEGHTLHVPYVAYAPNGQIIATGSWDGKVKIWDANNGVNLATFEWNSRVNCITFSHDGYFIIASYDDATIRIWDIRNNKQKKVFDVKSFFDLGSISESNFIKPGTRLALSPDQNQLAFASQNKTIILDMHSQSMLLAVNGSGIVAYTPDGNNIVSGDGGTGAKMWVVSPQIIIENINLKKSIADLSTLELNSLNLRWILEAHSKNHQLICIKEEPHVIAAFADQCRQVTQSNLSLSQSSKDYFYAEYLYQNVINQCNDSLLITVNCNSIQKTLGYLYTQHAFEILNLDRPDTALHYARVAFQKLPYYLKAGTVLLLACKYAKAIDCEEVKKNQAIIQNTADYFYENQKWQEAEEYYEKSENLMHKPQALLRIYKICNKNKKTFDFQRFLSSNDPGELLYYSNYFETMSSPGHSEKLNALRSSIRIGERVLEIQDKPEYRKLLVDCLVRLAYHLVLTNGSIEAESVISRGLALTPDRKELLQYFPHTLLFQPNRFEEAKKEYLNLAPKPYYSNDTFRDKFLEDFQAFRRAGIAPPRMDEIEALLKIPISK